MSRRFGRQQKKKMRAEIQSLQQKEGVLQSSISLMREGQREMRAALNLTAKVLGPHFISLPVECSPAQNDASKYRMASRAADICVMSNYDLAKAVSYSVHELDVMTAKAEKDKYTGAMHMRLQTPTGELRYAISREALQLIPKEDLVEEMAYQFAFMFAQQLEKIK